MQWLTLGERGFPLDNCPKLAIRAAKQQTKKKDHVALYTTPKIPTKTFQIRFKYIRYMKNFDSEEYYMDFRTLPFSGIYSFDSPDDQLVVLNKLILDDINSDTPL